MTETMTYDLCKNAYANWEHKERNTIAEINVHIGNQVATINSFLHAGTGEQVIRAIMELNWSISAPSKGSDCICMTAIAGHAGLNAEEID